MDKQPTPAPGETFNIVIIGAGGVNFGSAEGGPWNHSVRLERKVPLSVRTAVDNSLVRGCV